MGRFAIITISLAVFALALAPAPPVVATTVDFGRQLVPAGSWLGGHGVTVYSNGSSQLHCGATGGSCESRIGPHRDIDAGAKWQCVELAQRLYITRGWYPMKFGVAYAYQIWGAAPRLGMTRTRNGTLWAGSLHPGDMIVWKPSEDVGFAGHVAIVDTVVGTQVAVKEQNWGRATSEWDRQRGQSVYALARGRLNGHGFPPSDIYGIVHSPRNHLTNAHVNPGTTMRGVGDGGLRHDLAPVLGRTGAHRI